MGRSGYKRAMLRSLHGFGHSLWTNPFNRRFGRFQAFRRVLRWQLSQRLVRSTTALPFVEDTHLLTRKGMVGATLNFYSGLGEPEMAFLLHLLRPNDLFVDVGANVGSYSVLAAGVCDARVVAVEPIPDTFRALQANLAFNRIEDKVTALNVGLSGEDGLLRFSTGRSTQNRVLRPDEQEPSAEVPVRTLDAVCAGQAVTVMKIDVEGHEKAVLDGGRAVLGSETLLAVIMETNGSGRDFGVADADLVELMAGHGFSPHVYDPFERRLAPAVGAANTVFVRDAGKVEAICRAARRFRLLNGEI